MRSLAGRGLVTLSVLGVLVLLGAGSTRAGEFTGDVNFFLGGKSLDSDDWGSLDSQLAYGAEISWGPSSWPIRIATDVLVSFDSQAIGTRDVKGVTLEMDLGVRKVWGTGRGARPYVGGGLALLIADRELLLAPVVISASESGAGVWVGGGIFWRIGGRLNLGVAGRYSAGEVTLLTSDVQAGGVSFGLTLGWGWPTAP